MTADSPAREPTRAGLAAGDDAAQRSDAMTRPSRLSLAALIGLALAAHFHLTGRLNFNWDEFWFLSFVHDHARGTLASPMQSFHVHLLGWIPRLGGDELDQLIAGRRLFVALLAGTGVCLYFLARRIASVEGALFAVLCAVSYSNLLHHGTSFRTDGLSVFLLMFALVFAGRRSARPLSLVASALAAAVALLITIKSVLFMPALLVAVVASSDHGSGVRRRGGEALWFSLVVLAVAITLHGWHARMLEAADAPSAAGYLQSSAAKVVQRGALFPRSIHFQETVRDNLVQWGVLLYAVVLLVRRLRQERMVPAVYSALALLLPLLSVTFYRNAFPYFYVFVMPPALVLCAVGFDGLKRGDLFPPGYAARFPLLATLLLGVALVAHSAARSADETGGQRALVRAVHEIFPEPVPYIDRNGMIASFPKVGFFMSSWGLEAYRAEGRPVFAHLLRTQRPQLLVANAPALSSALLPGHRAGSGGLFSEDAAVLREHFVRDWGPIYVAGQRFQLEPDTEVRWKLLLPGSYDVQSIAPIIIDGVSYPPGASVAMCGTVAVRSAIAQEVVLRTSAARRAPVSKPPSEPIYVGFSPRRRFGTR